METFALERVEYFVDRVHSIKILRCVVFNIRCLVVTRLPHIGTVAVRHNIHNPVSQVFRRGVEVEHFVDVSMVDFTVDKLFNQGKITHHAIAVESLSTTIHGDFPIMAMEVFTFAFIVEIELMAG